MLARIYSIEIKLHNLSFPEGAPTVQLSLGGLLESHASFIAQRWNVATALLPGDRPPCVDLCLSTPLDEY